MAPSAASITVFDGHDTIGGTKILLAQGGTRLLLDFGTNYHRMSRYYEEYLQPRAARGLVDYLALGLLPRIRGAYRPDLFPPADYPKRDADWSGAAPDAVLLSHGHLDHAGGLAFLDPAVPVVCSPTTIALLRAWQAGKGGFATELTYLGGFRPTPASGVGDSQPGRLLQADREQPRRGRRFLTLGDCPGPLSEALAESPFSERTPFAPGSIATAPGRFGDLAVAAYEVDHSVYGARAFVIEADGGPVAYSGDLRFHGERGPSTEAFLRALERRSPEVLLVEGTRLRPEGVGPPAHRPSEEEVERNCRTQVERAAGRLVIADFGPRNVERLRCFRRIAQETDRALVLTPKDAYLLDLLHAADPAVELDLGPGGMRILEEPSAGREAAWLARVRDRFADAHLTPEEIVRAPGRWILCFSFFDCNDLVDLRAATEGGLWLYSSSEAHGEEQEFDFVRLRAWTDWAGLRVVGFRLERGADGRLHPNFEHPEDVGHHASGHATQEELVELVRRADPKRIVPVHTDQTPKRYAELLRAAGCRGTVLAPQAGTPITW